jgi:hypothetical protein
MDDTKEAAFLLRDFKGTFLQQILGVLINVPSVTGKRWRERIIVSPSDLLWLKTKPQQINLVALFFMMVISYIKARLYILKHRAISTEKVWLLFVKII